MVKKRNSNKDFLKIVGSLFAMVAFLHFIRSVYGWGMVIGNFAVPIFWSWYLFFTSAFFSFVAFSLINKVK
tara:strand:+ start:414 stop:626 length:213 start_codon:yes stop_codon:yes gene_type:complete